MKPAGIQMFYLKHSNIRRSQYYDTVPWRMNRHFYLRAWGTYQFN
jgi:hypothetical protein